jgi:hypothetical protein
MDKLIGGVFTALAIAIVTLQLAIAAHHDCAHNPPLQSTVFGKAVPIEAICQAIR